MARYLYVVDLQREFVKDKQGQKIYDKCINYIMSHGPSYDAVLAAIYKNTRENLNMARLVEWEEVKNPLALEFNSNWQAYHTGYSIGTYPNLKPHDIVDVIGFDTDACVLSACFDLFNLGVNLHILIDGCWSSGGKKMHEAGLMIMKRQFRKAVDEKFKL